MRVSHSATVASLWRAYKDHGVFPYVGGYLDQPIWFLSHVAAIDLVYDTRTYMRQKDADWSNLGAEALRMVAWLDEEDD